MDSDIEELKQHAKRYVELEARTEVVSVEYANTFSVFGEENIVFSVSTTDEEDPEFWVVTVPMNLYSKNRLQTDDDAFLLHRGVMERMRSSRWKKARSLEGGFNIFISFLTEGEDLLWGVTFEHTIYNSSGPEGIGNMQMNLNSVASLTKALETSPEISIAVVIFSKTLLENNGVLQELGKLATHRLHIIPILRGISEQDLRERIPALRDSATFDISDLDRNTVERLSYLADDTIEISKERQAS